MNTKVGNQDCKKCMWYESCKEDDAMHSRCEDYDPLNEDRRATAQYINNLNERQADYLDIMREFSDWSDD